ncbi:hypothetical protein Q4574_05285 [Aliiglaciecola sp. 3_MG-2023]|uniref:hypothetical protein n=1 Tax=Aliiglaciecola sp. 3_MG-2023 TaxID=3062644 RepID=UPI0026E45C2B|nr:hypothetical protein [Aliiglaciecola sp. 3_MG-2023]MDO6692684.1 hypothetical protein [Aliiglaciecola sp. 3_MG-2023]
MNKRRVGFSTILIFLISACSSIEKTGLKEVIQPEKSNPLKVKDALVAIFVNAPKPKVGTSKEEVKRSISSNSILILQQSKDLIVARFDTRNSQLESTYEYCDLEYHFSSSKFILGPYVIGDCSSIVIKATKVN